SLPLTDRNGIVCRHCNHTIDLTGKVPHRLPKPTSKNPILRTLERGLDIMKSSNLDNFITCDFCGREAYYEHDDIRPIASSWEQAKFDLESRLRVAENERDVAKGHAKLLAKELAL